MLELEQSLRSLSGMPCSYVSCGGSVGGSFELVLGKPSLRERPIANTAHPEAFRRFAGEASLFVWCSWRLEDAQGPFASSGQGQAAMVAGLERLGGRRIETAQRLNAMGDLVVNFEGGLVLRVFADHVLPDPDFDGNWELVLPEIAYSIGTSGVVEKETRHPTFSEVAG